jgi:hypothetical protein
MLLHESPFAAARVRVAGARQAKDFLRQQLQPPLRVDKELWD